MKTDHGLFYPFLEKFRTMKKNASLLFLILLLSSCSANPESLSLSRIEAKIARIQTAEANKSENILKNLRATSQASMIQYEETSRQQDSSSVYNALNKLDLIYIPAGEFSMGSSDSDSNHYEDEAPIHKVYLDPFWITKTQITNAMFAQCVEAEACSYSVGHSKNPCYLDPEYADHPVVYITWYMAQQYCGWTGGRLPSEAEWEKAARGVKGAKYPWGLLEPAQSIGVFFTNANNVIGDTTPAGLFPEGASYYGVLDMGGNVREWVADWYDPFYYQFSPYENPNGPDQGENKVLKGASYLDPYTYSRAANRLSHEPNSPGATRGFRCVYKEATTSRLHFTTSD